MFLQLKTSLLFGLQCYVTITTLYMYNVAAQCNSFLGPSGGKECLKLSGYNGYQWMTCRRDSFIRKISNNQHSCSSPLSIYCYYQCMLEVYGKESGDVTGSCKCSPGDTPPSAFPTVVTRTKCTAFFGPGGSKECKKVSGYDDYQWVTCASDSYVKEKSDNKYHCLIGLYCLFNCMIELYGKSSGKVYDNCRCSPGDTPPRIFPTLSSTKSMEDTHSISSRPRLPPKTNPRVPNTKSPNNSRANSNRPRPSPKTNHRVPSTKSPNDPNENPNHPRSSSTASASQMTIKVLACVLPLITCFSLSSL